MDMASNVTNPEATSAVVQQLTPNSSASDEQNRVQAGASRQPGSCNLCRRRKVKCDRGNPCSHCLRSGVACVSSTPLRVPRGRQGGRRKPDAELLKRIAKLENLVKDLETDSHGLPSASMTPKTKAVQARLGESDMADASARQVQNIERPTTASNDNLGRYLGSSFWITLSDEISGLREVLNDSSEDDLEDEDAKHVSHQNRPIPAQRGSSSYTIFGPSILEGTTSALQHPSLPQVRTLYSIYLTNVDQVFKLLHGSSLKKYLHGQGTSLDCSPGPGGLEALNFAIYYAATTTLSEEQCIMQLGEEKLTLLMRYRASIELALARADFVNTVELSTLQALVIFLVSVRSNDTTRFAWTVLSLAIRIANALGLHREESFASLRPFHKEMRRRLWWQIIILDAQAASDRGSDPIITKDSFNTRKPLHVNDEDLTPEGVEEPKERDSFTDMTFSCICHNVTDAIILLSFVPAGAPELAEKDVAVAWDQRRNLVITTQQRIQDKYLRYCHDFTDLFHFATKKVADIIMATMWLLLYRPLQKHAGYPTSLRPTHPNILNLSVEVMEQVHRLDESAAAQPVRWLIANYTQWHPLAITLAELCVQTEGPMVERAWSVVDAMFARTERTVADSNTGMLWAPIRKLARRARTAREQHLQMVSANPSTNRSAAEVTVPIFVPDPNMNMLDQGPGVTEAWPGTAPQQYFSSTSASAFDWNAMFPTDESALDFDLGDSNHMAWANWEGFVEDLYGPGDLMQGQEDSLSAPPDGRYS